MFPWRYINKWSLIFCRLLILRMQLVGQIKVVFACLSSKEVFQIVRMSSTHQLMSILLWVLVLTSSREERISLTTASIKDIWVSKYHNYVQNSKKVFIPILINKLAFKEKQLTDYTTCKDRVFGKFKIWPHKGDTVFLDFTFIRFHVPPYNFAVN